MRITEHSPEQRRFVIGTLWAAVILWAAFIFAMSAHTGADLSNGEGLFGQIKQLLTALAASVLGPDADIVSPAAHFIEYAVFGALIFAALRWSFPEWRSLRLAALAIVIASLYGVTDEFHQHFVPDRACDPVDWLVDTCGAALGAFTSRAALSRSTISAPPSEGHAD